MAQDSPHKLLGGTRTRVKIALASAAILALGALAAPRDRPATLSPPSERPAPLLESQSAGREAARRFVGVQEMVGPAAAYSVAIAPEPAAAVHTVSDHAVGSPGPMPPSGFGVVVPGEAIVLTHAAALEGRRTLRIVAHDGRALDAEVSAFEWRTGLTLLRASQPLPATVTFAPPADAGALAVAVGAWDGREIATPVFISGVNAEDYLISPVDRALLPGTPIYNLDGHLLAVAAGGVAPARAYRAREAIERLSKSALTGTAHPSSLGISFQSITGPLTEAVGSDGVLVADVVSSSPADLVGVQAGDVITAIGAAGVASADEARAAVERLPAAETTISVRRGDRTRDLPISPAHALEVAFAATAPRARPDRTPQAVELFALPALQQSAIPPLALVLGVNGQAVATRAEVQRILARARRPVVVYLEHAGQRFFAAIEPAP